MDNSRFKFRVWNIEHELYCDQMTEMVINSDGVCYDNGASADYFKHNGFIIEQCTGLSDKNGNLIYEGDIVKNKTIEYIVKWESCSWIVESKSNVNIGGFLDDFLHCEIIGNIHEQAEQKD